MKKKVFNDKKIVEAFREAEKFGKSIQFFISLMTNFERFKMLPYEKYRPTIMFYYKGPMLKTA